MRGLAVALAVLTALVLGSNARAATQACDGFESADGCLVTINGGDTPDPDDGYLVADRDGITFWSYYRDHGPQVLGYPVSQRFIYKGFVAQAFQKAVLQWRPELDRVARMNTLDVLARDYPDVSLANVPAHRTLPQDDGATFQQITANHRAILAADPMIERAFLDEPQWLDRFGLPIAYAEFQGGALSVIRAQRTVLQVWRVAAAGVTPGSGLATKCGRQTQGASQRDHSGRRRGAGHADRGRGRLDPRDAATSSRAGRCSDGGGGGACGARAAPRARGSAATACRPNSADPTISG